MKYSLKTFLNHCIYGMQVNQKYAFYTPLFVITVKRITRDTYKITKQPQELKINGLEITSILIDKSL